MPWTGPDFKSKHAKHLTDSQAEHAAKMANAMLEGGASEGVAIATAIKRAKKGKSHHATSMYPKHKDSDE